MSLGSRLRSLGSQQRADDRELRDRTRAVGATPIADARPGDRVVIHGVVASIVVPPSGSGRGLDAEIYDGTGRLRLVWMGRPRIAGIEPGRPITVEGRVVVNRRLPTLFNPRYTLHRR